MTRLESWSVVTRTQLESRWEKWWFDSSHVFHKMNRLESQSMTRVRVIFTISLSSWWTNPVRLHTKKWAFFASMMIKIGANFLFCLSSFAMLHFKDQVSPPCVEVDLWFAFMERSVGHNILTPYRGICISWSWQWASCCDLESFPDTSKVIEAFQIQIQTERYIGKCNANAKTESCSNPNSYHCHCY